MNVPTRLLILQRLTVHLEGITPANGYAFDLAGKVFRGRSLIGAEIQPDALSIVEAPRPDIASYAGEWTEMRHDQWTLLIQGLTRNDMLHPSDPAHWLCAEVETHLHRIKAVRSSTGNPQFSDAFNLGGLISGLEIAPPVVRQPDDRVSATAFFYLPVRVGVAVNTGQVYTSVS